jgi:hypothetical protein
LPKKEAKTHVQPPESRLNKQRIAIASTKTKNQGTSKIKNNEIQ